MEETLLALTLATGAAGGFVGAVPYLLACVYSRHTRSQSLAPGIAAFLASFGISVLILACSWIFLRSTVLVFALTFTGVFLVSVACTLVWYMRRPQSRREENS